MINDIKIPVKIRNNVKLVPAELCISLANFTSIPSFFMGWKKKRYHSRPHII